MIDQPEEHIKRDLYNQFRHEMNLVLRENDESNGQSQKVLLNELFKLEREFKKLMLMNEHGAITYKKFIEFILGDKSEGGKGNKLSIRPYFRERQDTFSNKVFPILDRFAEAQEAKKPVDKEAKSMHHFRINYLFVRWVLDKSPAGTLNYRGPNKRKMKILHDKIVHIRHLLCENNLPLALNRTALFFSKIPPSHAQYMDLVQDSAKGLLEAIDNFVPPYKTVFRSVAIGRIGLNMSEDVGASLVKLPPKDKRILYRVRKAKQKNVDISDKDLQAFVGESFKGTTSAEIEMIEAASNQVVSIDAKDEHSRPMSETIADPTSIEDHVERTEVANQLLVQLNKLKVIEKKVLLMKTGEIYGIFE
jgi:DNA-directed RNA polymerase specialized sigma subunit